MASCGPNNSAMIFDYEGFKVEKTLYNETFEVIYSMLEVEGFLFTGHSKGLIMLWDTQLGERLLKKECDIKEPVTAMLLFLKQGVVMVWAGLMNGDMLLLKASLEGPMTLEEINHVRV